MKYTLFLLVFILLSSCNNELPQTPPKHFAKSITLAPSKTIELDNYDILSPVFILRYKDWYVFRESKPIDNCYVKFLSTDFTKVVKGVSAGNGPLEIVGRFGVDIIDDSLFIIDHNHRKLLNIEVANDSIDIHVKDLNCQLNSMSMAINKNRFITPTRLDSCQIKITDRQNNTCAELPYLKNISLSNYEFMAQNSIYMNMPIAISPNKSKYAFGVMYANIYGFGRIIGDSLTCDASYEYSPMKIGRISDIEGDRLRIAPAIDNTINVVSAIGTKDYAIFVYSGHRLDDKVLYGTCFLLYKWDGIPYLRIDIDTNIAYICFDSERNILAGLSYSPEAKLVEYDLNGIIN